MTLVSFQARDSAHAVSQIRAQLGPEAIVLNVARLPATGLGRLWRRARLEVLAGVPEPDDDVSQARQTEPSPAPDAASKPFDSVMASIPPEINSALEPVQSTSTLSAPFSARVFLQQIGLLPLHAEKALERARAAQRSQSPGSLDELLAAQTALLSFWRSAVVENDELSQTHVFVGPPGAGKTTALCKWLAKAVLAEGKSARAWRLDGNGANFAGQLDLYAEILGVSLSREWDGNPPVPGEMRFVDFPGISATDSAGLARLKARVQEIPAARVHLVLNAAYEVPVMLGQARAFSGLPITDVILTHLDEEKRPGKLWNLVLGTNFTIGFLSGGQNVPGDFRPARPEFLFARQNQP